MLLDIHTWQDVLRVVKNKISSSQISQISTQVATPWTHIAINVFIKPNMKDHMFILQYLQYKQSNDRFNLFQDISCFPNLNHWSQKSKKSPECQRWKRMSREFMLETDGLPGMSVFWQMSYIHDLSTMLPRICKNKRLCITWCLYSVKLMMAKPKKRFVKCSVIFTLFKVSA